MDSIRTDHANRGLIAIVNKETARGALSGITPERSLGRPSGWSTSPIEDTISTMTLGALGFQLIIYKEKSICANFVRTGKVVGIVNAILEHTVNNEESPKTYGAILNRALFNAKITGGLSQ
jgi:hypothetical protein